MRRGLITGLALAFAVFALPASARAQEFDAGNVFPCYEWTPPLAAATMSPVLDLHVHVVLDEGVTLEFGRETMRRAQAVYEPLGLRLKPSFTTARTSSDLADDLFVELKSLFGGTRPPWAHVVYLLTNRNIFDDGNPGVAGKADCIGGVEFDHSAFAIGETHDDPASFSSLSFFRDAPPKVAAHEIAHLFGAHHHYSECASANRELPEDGTPCTLMFPDVTFASLSLSPVNAAFVRGHAIAHLAPLTASPPPDGSPTVPPGPRPCEITAYRDPAGDQSTAGVNNPPDVDLLAGTFHTSADGIVRFRWHVSKLTGPPVSGPAFTTYDYQLDIVGPKVLLVRVEWDGKSPPTATVGSSAGTPLRASVDVAAGVVEVELPAELAGQTLRLGEMRAGYNVDDDTALPGVSPIRPGTCSGPAEDSPHPVPAAGAPAGRPLALSMVDRSVRRRRLRVRVDGDLTDVVVRLADRRGRTVAAARAAAVTGSKVLRLRARGRRLRAGTYRLQLSGRDAHGHAVTRARRVRLRR